METFNTPVTWGQLLIVILVIEFLCIAAFSSGLYYSKRKKEKIYYYKSRHGQWISFTLNSTNGKKWNVFCQELMITRSDCSDPCYEDYIKFMKSIGHV